MGLTFLYPHPIVKSESIRKVKMVFCILLFLAALTSSSSGESAARAQYDAMAKLVSNEPYPSLWWEERSACLNALSPTLEATMERAWAGMQDYWRNRGGEGDTWHECDTKVDVPRSSSAWFEKNCTMQREVEMAIWEPCNYVSNLAYDRLLVEICVQQGWTLPAKMVTKIAESFAILTFGSSFMHGSNTRLGVEQDVRSNNLFPYIIHQAAVGNFEYNPIIHDLSLEPRALSAEEAVDTWLDMYNNKPVSEWLQTTRNMNLPSVQRNFEGIIGFTLTLLLDPETVDQAVEPILDLLSVPADERDFLTIHFLPAIRNATSGHYLGLTDRLELGTNLLAACSKLLYAFLWQEDVIDLGGANLSPEANGLGAQFLPILNQYANNRTSWNLHISDVQHGVGYPGHAECNPTIPHAKWHLETAAGLSDIARLVDALLRLTEPFL